MNANPSTTMTDEPSENSMLRALRILQRHPDCLRDDVVLNDLMHDIAAEIERPFDAALNTTQGTEK
jgi:hypothetical protein